jgi:hypothetical protein
MRCDRASPLVSILIATTQKKMTGSKPPFAQALQGNQSSKILRLVYHKIAINCKKTRERK